MRGCLPGGVYPGVSAQGGVCLGGGGCLARGCLPKEVSAQGCVYPGGVWPVNRMTDRCKTLPCHSYVADGNK